MNEPVKSQKELLEEFQLITSQAREHLIDFEIATNPKYDPNWYHEKIASELEHIEKYGDRDYKILIITLPPRHGKSQICSIDFPAWYLGRNPDKEIIEASYSADLAQDFGGKTREKVGSQEYRAIFPEVKLKEDEQARGRWRTNFGGSYIAVGVGGPITGRGANILIIDDPIKNREEASSEIYPEKIWEWFTSTAFTRLHPNGVVILILTRWHTNDLAGKILANDKLVERTKVLKFPAIANADGIHRKQGDPLWPQRYSFEALMEIKNTIGPYDWASLYQCSPILNEKQEFKKDWYKYIPAKELEMMETSKYLSIDTAMSARAQADFTGFCDNEVDKENFWNLRAWRARLGPEELVNVIFSLHAKKNYSYIGIEKTAYLDGLKPFLDSEQRKRNVFLPIIELKHMQTAKEIRIRSLIPRYASGSIRHVSGECQSLEEEQMYFPNGSNDDVLDATAYQDQLVRTKKSAVHIFRPEARRKSSLLF